MKYKVVEAFIEGGKIRDKRWCPREYIHQDTQGDIKNDRGHTCNGLARFLLDCPECFELYIEPKKAWVDSGEFIEQTVSNSECFKKDGAILLAREFLKRYNDRFGYKIMCDLVGEENLKGDK
jgi:hypothetical protein